MHEKGAARLSFDSTPTSISSQSGSSRSSRRSSQNSELSSPTSPTSKSFQQAIPCEQLSLKPTYYQSQNCSLLSNRPSPYHRCLTDHDAIQQMHKQFLFSQMPQIKPHCTFPCLPTVPSGQYSQKSIFTPLIYFD